MRKTILWVALLAGCGKGNTGELTVSGKIIDKSLPAIGVTVRASCGAGAVSQPADSNGSYKIDVDTTTCSSVVLEFQKESYLPLLRVLPIPPPTKNLTLNVQIARLSELRCGTTNCVLDGAQGTFPSDQFVRGFATMMSGKPALDFIGGELRDESGHVVWMHGFSYFDFRDRDGAQIARFDRDDFRECFDLDTDAQKWLVDVDPREEGVQLSLYDLDVASGRWRRRADESGQVQYLKTIVDPMTGISQNVMVPLLEEELPDVNSQQFPVKQMWMCTTVRGSGWMAWGRTNEPRSCVVFEAEDECHGKVGDAVIALRGRDFGFQATTWTSTNGKACVEVAPSEPTGEDYDGDHNSGETFFVDFTVAAGNSTSSQRASFESPRTQGSCAFPESCLRPSVLTLQGANLKCMGPRNGP